MYGSFKDDLSTTLTEIRDAGLYKNERELTSPQSAHVTTAKAEALNFCANNYLGLANHPTVVAAATEALQEWGFGMASVRFICGTQTQHTRLEARLSEFLGTEATILYSSCFDANGGVFEMLFGAEDAVISDELNHASIIDGIRLCKARRLRYRNRDMADLEAQLEGRRGRAPPRHRHRRRLLHGRLLRPAGRDLRPGRAVRRAGHGRRLARRRLRRRRAAAAPPSSSASWTASTSSPAPWARRSAAPPAATSARTSEIVDLLRQRSRPYLFSNAVAPTVAAGSLAALELAAGSDDARARLRDNATLFRSLMTEAGFDLVPGSHPIIPVMFPGEDGARTARPSPTRCSPTASTSSRSPTRSSRKGKARIRVQLSAAHTEADVRRCVEAFVAARDAVA